MPVFSKTSRERLSTCDPRLQEILTEAIKTIDFIVIEGHRGQEAQDRAFKDGKSKLRWPHGKHNQHPSKAVDIAPYFVELKNLDWKDSYAFGRLMGFIQRIALEKGVRLRFGLDWDGDFRSRDESFVDAPHIELVD